MESTSKRIFVTGGNAGIGLALCQQLVEDYNCYVYMGTRSIDRGQIALNGLPDTCKAQIMLV